ncbi:MAG TPA: haloacid dehalogenase, partial [Candidatus Nesterenkonia stercoripullorum]|nr:haloacid dehalogenase [Candidatus Nesterenkonia stercoripullorum]
MTTAREITPGTTTSSPWHATESAETRDILEAPSGGLTAAEAAARLERYGPNELTMQERDGWLVMLARQFKSPMVLFLFIAALVTALQQEWFDVIVIVLVLILNASIGFWQARKAESDVQALQNLTSPEAGVLRD